MPSAKKKRKHRATRPRGAETADRMPEVARAAVSEALSGAVAAEAAELAPTPEPEAPTQEELQSTDLAAETREPEPTPAEEPEPAEPAPAPGAGPTRKRGRPRGRSRESLAAENAELRARLQGKAPAAEVRDKRRQPPPPPEPELPPDPKPAQDLVAGLLRFIFGAVASSRGTHWEMPDDESERIALHFGKALAPWLPELGAALPWMFGSMALVDAIRRRAALDKGSPPRPAPAPAAAPPAPPSPGAPNQEATL